jgi:glycosyltransferase involved in cell wall biosynthesis
MINKKTISIVLATYNGAKYITQQIDSILSQTHQPDELIVYDDCSTDNTVEIINGYKTKARFEIKITVNQKNVGSTQNFNNALCDAKGDLVFLCDQDDYWLEDKIKITVDIARNNPDKLLFMNNADIVNENLKKQGFTVLDQFRTANKDINLFVFGCCIAVRRELLEMCLPVPTGYHGHDGWLVRYADALESRLIDETVLQYYRRHNNNVSDADVMGAQSEKITKMVVLKQDLYKLFCHSGVADLESNLKQTEDFSRSLIIAKSKSDVQYIAHLSTALDKVTKAIAVTKKRISIRHKFIGKRVVCSIVMWTKGEYASYSGLKSLLRDIRG